MKEYTKNIVSLLILNIVMFIIVPMLFNFVSNDSELIYYIILLLIVNPIFSFFITFTASNSKILKLIPVMIGIIYSISTLLIYNSSALFYTVIYIIVSIVGIVFNNFKNSTL